MRNAITLFCMISCFIHCSPKVSLKTLAPIEKPAKQLFYDHYNNWAKNGILPFDDAVYKEAEKLPIQLTISEKGFSVEENPIALGNFKLKIDNFLKQKKYQTPWIVLNFKSHTSNKLMTDLFDFLYQNHIRYQFKR